METLTLVMSVLAAVCGLGALICSILAIAKRSKVDERVLREQIAAEMQRQGSANNEAILASIRVQTQSLESRLAMSEQAAARHRQESAVAIAEMGKTLQEGARAERQELEQAMETMRLAMDTNNKQTLEMTAARLDAVRGEVAGQLKEVREENRLQMEQMRGVVDKQLHDNLESRLTQSFGVIGEQLQQVYKGLGEMQSLSGGVQDLKKVLSGVKTRGIWGELALGALLEDILIPEQYARDYAPKKGRDKVEFAVKLPGKGTDGVYLPIDSKFPLEYYERLVDASAEGDKESIARCQSALEGRIKAEAKDIRDKYLNPPATTDFAVMYLPLEGLFAEVVRIPGLVEHLRRNKIVVAGPTTLAALLNSLQVGFRTLAIEKRSRELWKLLESFRANFDRFTQDLAKAERQLGTVASTLQETGKRSESINKTLRKVSALGPAEEQEAAAVLLEDVDEEADLAVEVNEQEE